MTDAPSILRSSAVMAAGTAVSRLSGFVRSALLAAALGNALRAEVFNIANTVPNMLYILLAGGVINAVLVPQLVRALKGDPDGGDAYTARLLTLVGLFLAAVTAALIVGAPWLMQIFVSDSWSTEAFDNAVAFARLCLPQVFFYGMFVLVGQILNARGRFGPMMWAPIANNVVSVAMLVLYLVTFGADDPHDPAFGSGERLLLGLGSTAGIALQLLVLVPYLRAAGVPLRPRFDFRDAGLGHTLRLGVWTVLFVVVNQIAYATVVRLASGGTVGGGADDTGYTVYSSAFLLIMVPHSIVTVSLATALLPQLSGYAAEHDRRGLARALAPTLRTALGVMVSFAAVLPALAAPIAQAVWGYGAAADQVDNYVTTLILFGPGLVFFTVHYLLLRGFYAREENRTVFYIQCAVAATNIVIALVLVPQVSAANTAPALVAAYSASYAVGSVISYALLAHRLGGLHTPVLVRFLVRLIIAVAGAAAAAFAVRALVTSVVDVAGLVSALVVAGLVGGAALAVLLGLARIMRITELTDVVGTVTARLRR